MRIRQCTKCNETKGLWYFYTHTTGKCGRASICKECIKEKKRKPVLKFIRQKEMRTKLCPDCGVEKGLVFFTKRKDRKCGVTSYCLKCGNKRSSKSRNKYKENRNKRSLDYYYLNKEKEMLRHTQYRLANKQKTRDRETHRRNNDEEFNITKKIRMRIRAELRRQNIKKTEKTINLLGCSFGFYKKYLESKFTKDMTWKKLMNSEIQIDHIVPLNFFDLTEPEEQKKCFHYSNTQPLWASDNLKKGKKLDYKIEN